MKETQFKPAIWHNSLLNLQNAIHFTELDVDEDEEVSENALLGLLTFDDGLSLALDIPYGIIVGRRYVDLGNGVRAYSGEYEDVNAVFGYSQDGKWYVLRDIFVRGYTESCPGFSNQTIEGNSLTVSNKPISDNPVVDKVSVELDGFTKWFRNFNITRKYEMRKDEEGNYSGCKKVVHEYEPPDACTLYQDDALTITVEQTGTEAGGPVINPEAALSVASKLVVSYAEPIELNEAIRITVHQLRELISLLTGVYCSVEAIHASVSDEQLRVEYYAPFIRREHGITNDEVMHMPFPFPEIGEKISGIVDKWLGLCPDAVNAATIVVSHLDGSVMPCDLTFIACASALEALSRVEVNQERFEPDRFEACVNDALDAIKDDEFKEWLKRQVFNRRSAGSLTRALLKKLQPFSSYLLPNIEKFLHDHRVCRNAYVHRDGLESDAVLKSEDLHIHTKAVWLICYVAILDLIGIKPEESLEALKKSYYQSGYISQIRKQYAK